MAPRPVQIAAAGLVGLVVLAPLGAVVWRAESFGRLGAADMAALKFTLLQALLSAAFSVVLAIPVARALARRRFPGRPAIVALMGAPFILPTIVAIFGLIAVFGQNGLLAMVLRATGLPAPSIYGLKGVVLAHVFFNLPLATRLVLQGWGAIPSERLRLASQLALGARARFAVIEAPMLREVLPGAFAVIFVICLSSFAVALALGGGPRATTVELAIYQAFRYDFDLGRAALLAVIQLLLAGSAALAALRMSVPLAMGPGLDRPPVPIAGGRILDAIAIVLAVLFLFLPLSMVVARGLGPLFHLPPEVWAAAGHSLLVALGSTALTLTLALAVMGPAGEVVALLGIAISPLVLGTGLFILIQPFARPFDWALVVTAVVNTLMSLPFVLRILRPAAQAAWRDHGRLALSLGLDPWARWRWVLLPRMARPLGFAAGLSAALSMGDLGVIALFADPANTTLPLAMYRLMGSYRLDAAAGAALLLLGLSLGLFWLFDKGGRLSA